MDLCNKIIGKNIIDYNKYPMLLLYSPLRDLEVPNMSIILQLILELFTRFRSKMSIETTAVDIMELTGYSDNQKYYAVYLCYTTGVLKHINIYDVNRVDKITTLKDVRRLLTYEMLNANISPDPIIERGDYVKPVALVRTLHSMFYEVLQGIEPSVERAIANLRMVALYNFRRIVGHETIEITAPLAGEVTIDGKTSSPMGLATMLMLIDDGVDCDFNLRDIEDGNKIIPFLLGGPISSQFIEEVTSFEVFRTWERKDEDYINSRIVDIDLPKPVISAYLAQSGWMYSMPSEEFQGIMDSISNFLYNMYERIPQMYHCDTVVPTLDFHVLNAEYGILFLSDKIVYGEEISYLVDVEHLLNTRYSGLSNLGNPELALQLSKYGATCKTQNVTFTADRVKGYINNNEQNLDNFPAVYAYYPKPINTEVPNNAILDNNIPLDYRGCQLANFTPNRLLFGRDYHYSYQSELCRYVNRFNLLMRGPSSDDFRLVFRLVMSDSNLRALAHRYAVVVFNYDSNPRNDIQRRAFTLAAINIALWLLSFINPRIAHRWASFLNVTIIGSINNVIAREYI